MNKNLDKEFNLKDYILDVPNFPKDGIIFKDITPILEEPKAFNYVIDEFAKIVNEINPDVILGIESRGFIFAAPLAIKTNRPLIIARKPNKLPRDVVSEDYDLEYGKSSIQVHKGAIKENQKVLIIDDVVATGGTVNAVEKIIKKEGGICVGSCFVVNLVFLESDKLIQSPIYSIIEYK